MQVELKNRYGYLIYRKGQSGTFEIFDIRIWEDYRRLGYATGFLKWLEEIIGNNKTIFLFTRKENKIAHSLYEKNGYQRITEISNFYSENYSEIYGDRSGSAFLFIKII